MRIDFSKMPKRPPTEAQRKYANAIAYEFGVKPEAETFEAYRDFISKYDEDMRHLQGWSPVDPDDIFAAPGNCGCDLDIWDYGIELF